MGAALEKLGAGMCESIARQLLRETGKSVGSRLGVYCPWHEERTPGACWYDSEKDRAICYSCGNYGDIIDVFCQVEKRDMHSPDSFRAFFERFSSNAVLKIQGEKGRKTEKAKIWKPRQEIVCADNELWKREAENWVMDCAANMHGPELGRMMQWGINPDTVKQCCMGYNAKDNYVPFTSWGLPYAENSNGRERHIHLPQGFVFPVYDASGGLLRVKVRLDNPREGEPKYKAIVGGANCYAIYGNRKNKVWFVVETERDAGLLYQELFPFGIGAMGTGSASLPPDMEAHAVLHRSDCIINALDNDYAGASASWGFDPESSRFFWNTAYPQCLRFLVPSHIGKDPADLVGKMDIADWALSALPHHVRRRCLVAGNAYVCTQDF